jgi:hypothetical protein
VTYDPVFQARKNLEEWSASKKRRGESNHWKGFNPRIAKIKDLSTFRAVNASGEDVRLGLDGTRVGHDDDTREVFGRLVDKWGMRVVEPLLECRIGQPPSTLIRHSNHAEYTADFNDLHLINFALDFQGACLSSEGRAPRRVLEIGGGYGGTSAKIAKLFPEASFVLTDLPPACLLQTYYLSQLFPNDVAVVPLGRELPLELRHKRFVICSSDDLGTHLEWCDGAINTRAFGEMNRPVVRNYFDLIQSKILEDGIFMNVNRLQKVGYRFTDYPYDNFWELLSSETAFEQSGLWSLITRRLARENSSFPNWRAGVPVKPLGGPVERFKYRLFGLR